MDASHAWAILTAAGAGLMTWRQWAASRWLAGRDGATPAGSDRADPADRAAAVTVLKPLTAAHPRAAECLESWLAQDHPNVQYLLGLPSLEDPMAGVAREMAQRHPDRVVEIVDCSERRAANPKVSKLLTLAPRIRGEVLILSDADVRIPQGYISGVAAELGRDGVGLVTSLYRVPAGAGARERFEAFNVNADFWAQVLQARSAGWTHFALGAAMTMRRETLDAIGGFAALADCLADDNELGRLIVRRRKSVALSRRIVDCLDRPSATWAELWRHELRWAVAARVSAPAGHFFSILGAATLWPWLWLAMRPGWASAAAVCVCALLRMATGAACWRRMTGEPLGLRWWWIAPARDLWQAAQWAASLACRSVEWRGKRYRLLRGGRMRLL